MDEEPHGAVVVVGDEQAAKWVLDDVGGTLEARDEEFDDTGRRIDEKDVAPNGGIVGRPVLGDHELARVRAIGHEGEAGRRRALAQVRERLDGGTGDVRWAESEGRGREVALAPQGHLLVHEVGRQKAGIAIAIGREPQVPVGVDGDPEGIAETAGVVAEAPVTALGVDPLDRISQVVANGAGEVDLTQIDDPGHRHGVDVLLGGVSLAARRSDADV